MSSPVQQPTVTEQPYTGNLMEQVAEHPAFSQIYVGRVSGGAHLYGSDFKHNHYITLSISASKMHCHTGSEYFHSGREMIEVAMSEAQWATLISSPNQGGGVPCTLTQFDGKDIPRIPAPANRSDQFSDDLKKTLAEIQETLAKVEAMVTNQTLTKKQADEARRLVEYARMSLKSNTSYIAQRFESHVEGVIEKAKVEVNGYLATQALAREVPSAVQSISLLGGS